jgi:hypothetical protein
MDGTCRWIQEGQLRLMLFCRAFHLVSFHYHPLARHFLVGRAHHETNEIQGLIPLRSPLVGPWIFSNQRFTVILDAVNGKHAIHGFLGEAVVLIYLV